MNVSSIAKNTSLNDGVTRFESSSDFMDSLCSLVKGLGTGEFSLTFYIYIESNKAGYMIRDCYTLDYLSKDCLIKLPMSSYGYIKVCRITLKLFNGN